MDKSHDRTDRSLAIERDGCDEEFIGPSDSDRTADEVIEVARHEADAVLLIARETADKKAEPLLSVDRVQVEEAREQADALVETERQSADDTLRRERESQRKVVGKVQAYVRIRTDRDLAAERADGEKAIAIAKLRD